MKTMNDTFKTKLKVTTVCGSARLESKKGYVAIYLENMRGALTALKLKNKDVVEVTLKKVVRK